MKRLSSKSYFQLERRKLYICSLDVGSPKLFEYKLHKHYLVYRRVGDRKWRGVWNADYYNDAKAAYLVKK